MTTADLAVRRDLADHPYRPLRAARIPLAKLRVHPRHIRQDMGDLTELANSLVHDGQHQLIKVDQRGEFFQILEGHRRFAAATLAGLRTLNAEIVPARSNAEAVALMLTTGVHAKPLAPAERSHAVRLLIDEEGMSTADVAARCGVTPATIRRWYAADNDAGDGAPAAPAAPVRMPRPRRTDDGRPLRKPTTIGVSRLTGLANRWAERCHRGLSPEHAQALLEELRALAAGQFT